jgi:ribonuclease HIII
MDGVELIHQLGALGFAGGVVLCSGADPSVVDAAQRLLAARGIRCLGPVSKPLTHEQLADVWRAWQALNPAS